MTVPTVNINTIQASSTASRSKMRDVLLDAGGHVYTFFLNRRIYRPGVEKAIELKALPLLPLILATSVILYHKGMQAQKAKPGGSRRMLLESGLSYAVVEGTRGVYPLWGLGLAAYRAGRKKTALEALQVGVNTAVTLVMGYLGLLMFKGMTNASLEFENNLFSRHLKHEGIQGWMQRLSQHPDTEVQKLGNTLLELHKGLQAQNRLYQKGMKPHWKEMQPLLKQVAELKTEAQSQLSTVSDALIRPKGLTTPKLYMALKELLSESQRGYIKISRVLNPLCGYVLVGLMAGSGLAAYLNKQLANRYPQLKKFKTQPVFSEDISLLPSPGTAKSFLAPSGGNHGGLSGPSLFIPSISDKPMH